MKESTKTLARFLVEADAEVLRLVTNAESAEAIIALARERGHDVSSDDLLSLARTTQLAKAVEGSQELRAQLEEVVDSDSLLRIAKEHGCSIEPEDLDDVNELSDDQLERVSGGVGRYNFYEGWPCKWFVPELDSDQSAMAIEKIEIAVEKIGRFK